MNLSPPTLDLFCLPCAGASATMYLRWRRALPSWIRVLPVELPGRGGRLGELYVEDFQTLVTQLSDEISCQIKGPWALFGHSMGALLAFGVVSCFQAGQCSSPAILFASGSPAPSRRDPDRFPDTNNDAALIADLRQQGGTPQEVFDNPELLSLVLDTLRADYRVCKSFTYSSNKKLDISIQVLAGRQDVIAPDKIEAWREETSQSFGLDWFDGGHFFFRQQETQVLKTIERSLRYQLENECRGDAISYSANRYGEI